MQPPSLACRGCRPLGTVLQTPPQGNRVVPTFLQAPLGAPPRLTFAVFAVPRVARLADTLVRPWGVLADGIDVAMVRAFHTLVYVCQGRGDT